jgi:excisionase family DNA binding protein
MEIIALSIKDTAKALSLGRTSIYGLIKEGRLETLKLGRRTLIKTDSIRRLMQGQSRTMSCTPHNSDCMPKMQDQEHGA